MSECTTFCVCREVTFSPALHSYYSTCVSYISTLYMHAVGYVSYVLRDEEEDDEMDFSGVKTVNLQVSGCGLQL